MYKICETHAFDNTFLSKRRIQAREDFINYKHQPKNLMAKVM